MDIIYEESAASQNAKKGEKWYKVVNAIYKVALVLAILCFVFLLMNLPFGKPGAGATEEQAQAYAMVVSFAILFGFATLFFASIAVSSFLIRRRLNISYDYIFVSGELRISKVFNVNKRKLVVRLEPEHIIQLGDVENASYERFKSDPTTKEVVVTPNYEAAEGKFFMYVYANDGTGKKIYVLECREELLVNILKFVKRGTLESDYVSLEKKEKMRSQSV